MKQVFIKNGIAILSEVPVSQPGNNELLVRVGFSCISPGTERKRMVDSESGSVVKSAVEKPARVKKAYHMMRSEGIRATLSKVKGDFDLGRPSGYSLSGIVMEVGKNVNGYSIGDRVACAGAENAFHAEFVCVPSLLAVPVPDRVDMQQASTVALGAISVQGIRRSNAQIGEYLAVIGLGALGQMTGLLLRNAGCQVIGFDLNRGRLELAKSLGFQAAFNPADESVNRKVEHLTKGQGVDAVVITAASIDSSPIELAANICRKKGKVVVVGDSRLNLNRKDWYPKELDLLISTSYGPGRYDQRYEQEGQDYPHAYVRWTENRNMASFLERLQYGLNISPLINQIYPLESVQEAYQSVLNGLNAAPLVLLQYDIKEKMETRIDTANITCFIKDRIKVAIIGAGDFARAVHLPNLRKLKNLYEIYAIAGRNGYKTKEVAMRYGAHCAVTDYERILEDKLVDLVFITSRHNLHTPLAIRAAQAGKAIFVEKPIATTREQLTELQNTLEKTKVPFMAGFNRRFSPHITRLKELLQDRKSPLMIYYRVNANSLPLHHWVHSIEGGGRIIGEGCHFIDLLTFLISSKVDSFSTETINPKFDQALVEDNFQVTLKYKDGSLANLYYTSIGTKEFPKEYMEIFFDGQVITLNNFRELKMYGSKLKPIHTKLEEKGHLEELEQMSHFLKGKNKPPIGLKEMISTTLITFEINEKLKDRINE